MQWHSGASSPTAPSTIFRRGRIASAQSFLLPKQNIAESSIGDVEFTQPVKILGIVENRALVEGSSFVEFLQSQLQVALRENSEVSQQCMSPGAIAQIIQLLCQIGRGLRGHLYPGGLAAIQPALIYRKQRLQECPGNGRGRATSSTPIVSPSSTNTFAWKRPHGRDHFGQHVR